MTPFGAQRNSTFRLARLLATTALCASVSFNASAYDRHTAQPSKPSVELNLRALDALRAQVAREITPLVETPAPFQQAPSVTAEAPAPAAPVQAPEESFPVIEAQTEPETPPAVETSAQTAAAQEPVPFAKAPSSWTEPPQLTESAPEQHAPAPQEESALVAQSAPETSMPPAAPEPESRTLSANEPERVKEEDTIVGVVGSWVGMDEDGSQAIELEPAPKQYTSPRKYEDDTVVGIVSSWLGMNEEEEESVPTTSYVAAPAATAPMTAEEAYAQTAPATGNDFEGLPPEMGGEMASTTAATSEYDLTAPPQEILLAQASQAAAAAPAAPQAVLAEPEETPLAQATAEEVPAAEEAPVVEKAPMAEDAGTEIPVASATPETTTSTAYTPHYYDSVSGLVRTPDQPVDAEPVRLSAPAPDYEEPDTMAPDSALAQLAGYAPASTVEAPVAAPAAEAEEVVAAPAQQEDTSTTAFAQIQPEETPAPVAEAPAVETATEAQAMSEGEAAMLQAAQQPAKYSTPEANAASAEPATQSEPSQIPFGSPSQPLRAEELPKPAPVKEVAKQAPKEEPKAEAKQEVKEEPVQVKETPKAPLPKEEDYAREDELHQTPKSQNPLIDSLNTFNSALSAATTPEEENKDAADEKMTAEKADAEKQEAEAKAAAEKAEAEKQEAEAKAAAEKAEAEKQEAEAKAAAEKAEAEKQEAEAKAAAEKAEAEKQEAEAKAAAEKAEAEKQEAEAKAAAEKAEAEKKEAEAKAAAEKAEAEKQEADAKAAAVAEEKAAADADAALKAIAEKEGPEATKIADTKPATPPAPPPPPPLPKPVAEKSTGEDGSVYNRMKTSLSNWLGVGQKDAAKDATATTAKATPPAPPPLPKPDGASDTAQAAPVEKVEEAAVTPPPPPAPPAPPALPSLNALTGDANAPTKTEEVQMADATPVTAPVDAKPTALPDPTQLADNQLAAAAAPTPVPANTETETTADKTTSITGSDMTIVYNQTETSVPLSVQSQLSRLVDKIKDNESQRITLVAYASGTTEQASTARRVALARALAVRTFLIDHGIENLRINVQAEGNRNTGGDPDRVDIFLRQPDSN